MLLCIDDEIEVERYYIINVINSICFRSLYLDKIDSSTKDRRERSLFSLNFCITVRIRIRKKIVLFK